jgi:hypothetical protein
MSDLRGDNKRLALRSNLTQPVMPLIGYCHENENPGDHGSHATFDAATTLAPQKARFRAAGARKSSKCL